MSKSIGSTICCNDDGEYTNKPPFGAVSTTKHGFHSDFCLSHPSEK